MTFYSLFVRVSEAGVDKLIPLMFSGDGKIHTVSQKYVPDGIYKVDSETCVKTSVPCIGIEDDRFASIDNVKGYGISVSGGEVLLIEPDMFATITEI
jgi:hypothetical protein